MRGTIVGLATACAITLAALAYWRVASTTQDEQQDWRQRELAFLLSVHERIRTELGQQPAGAVSLRDEERVILQAMAAVAKPMSSDSIPADVRVLVAVDRSNEGSAASPSAAAVSGALPQPAPAAPVLAAFVTSEASATTSSGSAAVTAEAAAPSIDQTPAEPIVREVRPTDQPPRGALPDPSQTPLEAALNPEKTDRGLRVRLPAEMLFGKARNTLDAAAEPTLANLVELIKAMRPKEVVVVGHTDASSDGDADLALSKDRARAVSNWLTRQKFGDKPHLVAQGYGGTRPFAPNENADGTDNPDGRGQNRRIEILLRRR